MQALSRCMYSARNPCWTWPRVHPKSSEKFAAWKTAEPSDNTGSDGVRAGPGYRVKKRNPLVAGNAVAEDPGISYHVSARRRTQATNFRLRSSWVAALILFDLRWMTTRRAAPQHLDMFGCAMLGRPAASCTRVNLRGVSHIAISLVHARGLPIQ